MSTIKGGVLIYICAGLLLTGGVLVTVSTVWYLLRVSYLFWLSDFGFELGAGLMLAAGAMLTFPTGWLATMLPERARNFNMYSTLLCLVGASMLLMATGMSISSGLSHGLRDPGLLNKSMLKAISLDRHDYSVKRAFAAMQTELKCCGVNSYLDWLKHRYNVDLPPSCCGRIVNYNKEFSCASPMYREGCLTPVLEELRKYIEAVAVFTYSLLFILAVSLAVVTFVIINNWLIKYHSRPEILVSHLPQAPVDLMFH